MGKRANDMIRMLGFLFLILSASMLIPLSIALYHNETASSGAFLIVISLCALLGGYIRIIIKPSQAKWRTRDGFLVVSLAWLTCSFLGCLPFVISGAIPSCVDAFFESCSGFSTTGATILTDIEVLPKSILFWRSMTHWLGGMGIVVIVTALMPAFGITGQIAANAETTGPSKGKLTGKFSDTARSLYKIYAGLTLLQAVLLTLGGMSLYDAFIHAFGSMGTGGFSNYNDSIAHFDSVYIEIVIIVFMVIAGTNFNLFFLARRRGFKVIAKDEEVRFYLAVIGIVSAGIFACNAFYNHFEQIGKTLLDAIFQVVSIITTTGFCTDDYTFWPTFSQMLLLCLFFIGGCSSSTAGGVKCIRIVLYLKLIQRSFSLRIHPHRVAHITVNGTEVSTDVLIRSTNFLFTYVSVLLFGTLLLSLDGFDLMTTFSAAATCLGNIGPGFNLLGPVNNFSGLSDFSTLVCALLMLIGRVELTTFLALFSRHYWNSNRA